LKLIECRSKKRHTALRLPARIARHLGLHVAQVCSGCVNFRDGDETTAYYTDNLEDAVNTAVEMARKREL
jgi:L-ribulose-5-phosphate 3-epimerase UlaE